jgi:uncharacterized lipoprotein NlpE involved in copper resistance
MVVGAAAASERHSVMRQNTLIIVSILISTLLGCDNKSAPAYAMSEAERQRAQAIVGFWSSTQDDVGFTVKLDPDGTATGAFGTPVESVKGPWWVASSPERLVIQRKDQTLIEYKIVRAVDEALELQALPNGPIFTAKKALVVGPR